MNNEVKYKRRSLAWYDWLAFLTWLVSTILYLWFKGAITLQANRTPAVIGAVEVLSSIASGILLIYGLWKGMRLFLWAGALIALVLFTVTPVPVTTRSGVIYLSGNGYDVLTNGTYACEDALYLAVKYDRTVILGADVFVNGERVGGLPPGKRVRMPIVIYTFNLTRYTGFPFRAEVSEYDSHLVRKLIHVLKGNVKKVGDVCSVVVHYATYEPPLIDRIIGFLKVGTPAIILAAISGLMGAYISSKLRKKRGDGQ